MNILIPAVLAALPVAALASAVFASAALAQPMSPEQARCASLRGMSIAADAIGLPTSGADIHAAALTEAAAAGGSLCVVLGSIDPVDPEAPDINFEVNLPLEWNGKAIHYGGGGYDGSLVTGLDQVKFGRDDADTPLQRGYATFGSDSGHQSTSSLDGTFMMNDEALANFGGEQLKKTHDVAMAVIEQFYGKENGNTYWQGSSQGGHEGMNVIQRWPDDYEGALITHPANPFSALQLSGNRAGKALYKDGAWLSPEDVELLNNAVYDACDGLDGATDHIISNTRACATTFDVQSLRCDDGSGKHGECLGDAQIEALNVINSRFESPVELQGGATGFARWPIFEGGDLYGLWGMGKTPEPTVPPTPVANFGLAVLADPAIRFAILRDPDANSLEFDPADHGDRIREISEIIDSNDPDLSAFADRGGKLLLMHGTIDFAITPHNTTEYYERVVEEMGQERADEFLRYYVIPGFGHGSGVFVMRWDPLTVLENWVEKGEAPGDLVTVDASAENAGRTRPMCEYPAFPMLNDGAEDTTDAANYRCATE